MRAKIVFSGTFILAVAAVAVVAFVSRGSKISANVYYYCWECASVSEELGCVQVQYESPDHISNPVCPEGTYLKEGACALTCVDPTPKSSEPSASSVSSESESSVPAPQPSSPPSSDTSSSSSSEEVYVILGNVPWTAERIAFFGLSSLFVIALVAGAWALVRRR